MDGLPRDEVERLLFFESARVKAASDYNASPLDADNLTRWGGALLELAHFRQGQESMDMIEEAESKLEEALRIHPKKTDALWCLGNAHTAHGFMFPESGKAHEYFKKATQCFQKALDEEPTSDMFQKALEMSQKAPALYLELQKQMMSQQLAMGNLAPMGVTNNSKGQGRKKGKKKNSDLKYDFLGWVILAIGVVAWVGMAKSAPPLKQ